MKKTFTILTTIALSVLSFVSCQEDNKGEIPDEKKPVAPIGSVSDITFYTADISGKLELSKEELSQSEFGLLLSTSSDVMAVNSTKYPIKDFDKDYNYTISLSGLDSVTNYYYRSYIYYDGNYIYSDVQNFKTLSPLDIIKTGSIGSDSCTVISRVESQNLLEYIQTYGICYGTNPSPSVKDLNVFTDSIGSGNTFALRLQDIPFDNLVNYRAYVRINGTEYYGPVMSFEGNTVRTGIINVSDYTVTSHLKIKDNYKELGVCYGIDSIPLFFNKRVNTAALNDSNNFRLKLIDIPFDTIVYYRAYVQTADSIYYGQINSFGGNTVTTGIIDTVSFQIRSSVSYIDGISQYGVCYSNSEHPTVFDKTVYVNEPDSAGSYTLSLTNVPFGMVYYRSYVMKDGVAYYGDIRMFDGNSITTGDFNPESLTAQSRIKFSNSYDYLELGFCYGNNPEPTIYDKRVFGSSVNAENIFEIMLQDVPFGTVYYRSFMMYDGVPQYGEVKSFEGNAVTTGLFSEDNLTAESSIRYSSGYNNLELGICYSNKEQPTINDRKVTTNSVDSLNSFSLMLTEIPFGTVYYRSFMMYDGVPQYGEVKSFEGNAITTGEYDTDSITVTSSIKISEGYNKLDIGICYSTEEQPTINNHKVTANAVESDNSFTIKISPLPFGTFYYRSYMILDGIPHYGEVKSGFGNEVVTGDYDPQSLAVKSHIKINDSNYRLTYGVCYGGNEEPTIDDKIVTTTDLDSNNDFTLLLKNNPVDTKVYYRAYVIWDGVPNYDDVKSFVKELTVRTVDLGLSVRWASFNVGADFPEDYGDYYAWGETETKSTYDWSTYKWCNGSHNTLTKYNTSSSYGTVDNNTVLDPEDDVAHVKWGGSWRMPTKEEQDELFNNCTWTWYSSGNLEFGGVAGYKVTSKKSGYTDRFIFLPAAGWRNGTEFDIAGSYGLYWSSSLLTDYPDNALYICFTSSYVNVINSYDRYDGQSVRPVCP